MAIRNLKDFLSGAMFVVFGGLGLWFGRDYNIGTAFKMGPGYFPRMLSIGLIVVGVIVLARALIRSGEAPEKAALRPLLVVLGAVTAFGLLIESTGLLLAVIVTILLGGFATRESKPLELAALAVGLAAFSAGLFVYGLGQPIPLWPH